MNQRIRQLAEQCRFEIQGINCEVLGQGFDEEKFAKLLEKEFEAKHFSAGYIAGQSDGVYTAVRECAELFPLTSRPLSGGSIQYTIKQHFGVER